MKKPVIGITMGDPAGIGPEICLKSLSDYSIYERCNPLIIGDATVMKLTTEHFGYELKIHAIKEISEANFTPGIIDVFDLKNVNTEALVPGTVSAMAGNAAFEAVRKVIELALEKKIDATVTAPINKESIRFGLSKYY